MYTDCSQPTFLTLIVGQARFVLCCWLPGCLPRLWPAPGSQGGRGAGASVSPEIRSQAEVSASRLHPQHLEKPCTGKMFINIC